MKVAFQNILKWINDLSVLVKVIPIIITLAGGITIIITKHDKKIMDAYQKKTTETMILTKIDSFGVQIGRLGISQDSILYNQRRISGSVNRVTRKVDIIQEQLGIHIINTATDKQEILNYFNAIEKKNNNSGGTGYYPIPLPGNK